MLVLFQSSNPGLEGIEIVREYENKFTMERIGLGFVCWIGIVFCGLGIWMLEKG
jgi:hypothetical protein